LITYAIFRTFEEEWVRLVKERASGRPEGEAIFWEPVRGERIRNREQETSR
jgi:hypothetical protein